MPDIATGVGEFFGCWKIFSIHFDRQGVWDIQHHHFCHLLADLWAYLLCKHAEMVAWLLGHSRSLKGFDVVCHITQSVVRLKSNAVMGHPCLTPVFTPKLDSLFPTLHLKLLFFLGGSCRKPCQNLHS